MGSQRHKKWANFIIEFPKFFAKAVGIVVVGALYVEDKSSFAAMCSAGTINKCNF